MCDIEDLSVQFTHPQPTPYDGDSDMNQITDLRNLSGEQLLLLDVYSAPQLNVEVDHELTRRSDVDLLEDIYFDSVPAVALAACS